MRYLIAVVLPPLAFFTVGKVFQAILCIILMLTCIGWPVASIWALLVVADYHADRRAERLAREMERGRH